METRGNKAGFMVYDKGASHHTGRICLRVRCDALSVFLFPFLIRIEGLGNPFGNFSNAGYFFSGKDLLPVIEAGAAIEFDGVGFVLRQFCRVLGTAGVLDDVFDFISEVQAQ